MNEADINYYRRRAEQARRQAERAADAPARHAHLTMASRYDQMLAGHQPEGIGTHIVERG